MVQFTEAAARHLKESIASTEIVRVAVQGGGCAGMSYAVNVETEYDEEDILIEFGHVKIYIDPHSALILKETTVDYVETLYRKGFNFINPEANTTCGCGMSFS
tara:strand:+ start:171 stop:479 length:309 start_codon:yes stop_codon:yes gene_type:complete